MRIRADLVQRYSWKIISHWHNAIQSLNACAESMPVFLFGCQRSGTNMIVRQLSRSWDVELHNENSPAAFDNYHLRSFEIIEDLLARSEKRIVLLKPILDSYRIIDFFEYFDNGLFIYIYRHYFDVINSLIRTFGDDPAIRTKEWIENGFKPYPRFRKSGWDGSLPLYERINDFSQKDLNVESWTAIYWLIQASFILEYDLHHDERIKLVQYESLVQSPKTQIQSLCSFLDIKYHPYMIENITQVSINKFSPPQIRPELEILLDEIWGELTSLSYAQ